MKKNKGYLRTAVIEILVILLIIAAFFCIRRTGYEEVKAENKKKTVIGVTFASDEASYQQALGNLLEKEAENDRDYVLDIRYSHWDVKEQEKQLRSFIKNKVGAIIFSPVNAKSYLNVLKDIKKAGIPVINLNMKVDTVSTEYTETYIGASMSEEADLAAKMVVDYLKGESGKVGIIEGVQGSDPQIYRTQTFLEYLASYPQIEIVGIMEANWSRKKAGLAALDLLNKDKDIDVIYCHDSNMAMGVYDALKTRGMEKKIGIIGIGNEDKYMEAVRNGKLYGIVSQPPEFEAAYAWSCAKRAAAGEHLRCWYKNPVEILTKDTIEQYQTPFTVDKKQTE